MKKFNSLNNSSFIEDNDDEKKDNKGRNQIEKILCNHCGRTKNNGIRCLGICVADNDY